MNSKIFLGHIEHHRYVPELHQFRYPIYMYGLDLDELDDLDSRNPLFGYNRRRLSAIYDADYLNKETGGIRQKIDAVLGQHGINAAPLRIVLVTAARFLNYVFNPVSFYYCLSPADELVCVVTEVNNTFGEKHLYVLNHPQSTDGGSSKTFSAKKVFHVSPFNNMEGTYEFFFSGLHPVLDIRIHLIREGQKVFDARLSGTPLDLTWWNHAKTIIRHPATAHLSVPRIYREAFNLYVHKKLVFNSKPAPASSMTIRSAPPSVLERVCRRLTIALLSRMTTGRIRMKFPDGTRIVFGESGDASTAEIEVRDNAFFTRVVFKGEIGLGESYMHNEWHSPDLVGLYKICIDNRDRLIRGNKITSSIAGVGDRLRLRRTANTINGSRRNIARHYDIGNDFYKLFLDDSLIYSCAVFDFPEESLEKAQRRKIEAIIKKAGITSEDHILEIGCGWGGFAIEAAKSTGCRVTGITVSPAQYECATERIREEGLTGQITILLQDYRHLDGQFDKIVSIEMLEAVGGENFGTFFRRLEDLLKPNGIVLIQSITIPDQFYNQYRKEQDWIQKHIFPGGHLPSLTALSDAMTRHSNLMIEHLENIGTHYALTLKNWRMRFLENIDKVEELGFDPIFIRKWEYYFSICEAAFAKRALGDIQMVLTRPCNSDVGKF